MVLDPPLPDVGRLKREPALTLLQTADLGEQYLTFDQSRDELLDGDVKGAIRSRTCACGARSTTRSTSI